MFDEVVRVGHAVSVDVGPVWILWIGPRVVCLGIEIVPAAGTARRGCGSDGDWRFGQVLVGSLEDPVAFPGRDVNEFMRLGDGTTLVGSRRVFPYYLFGECRWRKKFNRMQ